MGYTALNFVIQERPHLLLKVNFVESPPQFLIIINQMRQYMYWLWMKYVLQSCLLIAYKWLHNFAKPLDEIFKKMQIDLIWCLLLAVWNH